MTRVYNHLRLFAAFIALLLVASACTGGGSTAESDDGDDDGTTTTTEAVDADGDDGSPDTTDAPPADGELQPVICPFQEPEGVEAQCNQITVPENWDTGEGSVTLTIGVLPSRTPSDNAPIVYLDGGPGAHALDTLFLQYGEIWEGLAEDYDLVFFDQRGTGFSEPSLRCPELTDLTREAEDDPSLTPEELELRTNEILADCVEGFAAAGIDTSQYNTINNARDTNAIREALGLDEWNLLGISYGTKLALEIVRQFPDTVRSSVIDSVYPPQVDSTRDGSQTFLDSFELVSAACDAEPACAAQGNLKDRMVAAATELEESPREVIVTDFLTGESDTVQVNGDALVGLVAGGLYSPFAFTDWPEMLTDIEDGGTTALGTYLSLDRTNEPFLTAGMFLTFQCNEEVPFADAAEVEAAAVEDPFGLYDSAFESASLIETCEAYGAIEPDPVLNEPVTSDIPTLVLAGEFDPVTPPSWSELAAETLPNSQYVLLTGESHGVSGSPCGRTLIREFLDDPEGEVDTDCADDGAAAFVSSEVVVEVEPTVVSFSVEPETTVIQPVGWDNTNVGGVFDSRRSSSLLDVAELLQLSGPEQIADEIERFLNSQVSVQFGEPSDSDLGDGDWTFRTADNGRIAVDFYQRGGGQETDVVVLIANTAELEALREQLLEPAVEGFRS